MNSHQCIKSYKLSMFILIMQEYHNFCKVVDELQVGYTIIFLTFKYLFSYNNYYEQ